MHLLSRGYALVCRNCYDNASGAGYYWRDQGVMYFPYPRVTTDSTCTLVIQCTVVPMLLLLLAVQSYSLLLLVVQGHLLCNEQCIYTTCTYSMYLLYDHINSMQGCLHRVIHHGVTAAAANAAVQQHCRQKPQGIPTWQRRRSPMAFRVSWRQFPMPIGKAQRLPEPHLNTN